MSHPQPPQRQPTPNETERYARTLHNTALAAVIVCPIIALLPPRKLDIYTFTLGGTTVFSANWLVRERSGQSIWQHVGFGPRPSLKASNESLGVSPTEQANLQREINHASQELQRINKEEKPSVTEQVQSQRQTWKKQQQKEIEEDVEEGKSIADVITGQIWNVWNWGKKDDDDD
jgi:hypothetical protein